MGVEAFGRPSREVDAARCASWARALTDSGARRSRWPRPSRTRRWNGSRPGAVGRCTINSTARQHGRDGACQRRLPPLPGRLRSGPAAGRRAAPVRRRVRRRPAPRRDRRAPPRSRSRPPPARAPSRPVTDEETYSFDQASPEPAAAAGQARAAAWGQRLRPAAVALRGSTGP